MRRICACMLLVLLSGLGGCARYGFSFVEPADLAPTLRPDEQVEIPEPPLKYVFANVDGRLGVAIVNEGETLVRLLGQESYVVDPDGETHPLPSRIIAPNSHVSFLVPPPRQTYQVWGPPPAPAWYGYGYGYGYGPGIGYRYHSYSPFPQTYDVLAPATEYDWVWRRGPARIHFVYLPTGENAEPIVDDFVINRQKLE